MGAYMIKNGDPDYLLPEDCGHYEGDLSETRWEYEERNFNMDSPHTQARIKILGLSNMEEKSC